MRDGMIRETQMGHLGFFDAEKRLAALSAKGDPLEAIDRLVPWRQRLSLGRDRGDAQGAGLQEPHPCPRSAQSSTLEGERGGEPEEESGSRSRRARVRGSGDFIGWPDRSDDRHRQGTSEDRITEPRLQHPSPRDTRTDGRRMRVASVYAAPEWPAAAPSAAASTPDRP